ncbi:MAG: lysylphosphatidylglycerol synthase domain-containing protein, partial [Sedimenticolaceae bacterium]
IETLMSLSPGPALKWLTMLLMLAGLVWWVERRIGFAELLRPWARFPVAELVLLVMLTALSYLTRALRLRDFYRTRFDGSIGRYLRVTVLHTAMLNLLPMRSGEAAFPLLMKRQFGRRYLESTADLIWLRFSDLWILLWLGVLAAAWHLGSWLWLLVAVLPVPLLMLQPFKSTVLGKVRERHGRGARALRVLLGGLPDSYGLYLRLLSWTLLTWALKLGAFVGVAGFFIDVPVVSLIPGVIAAEVSNALPVQGLGGFGSYEFAMVIGSQWVQAPHDALLSAAVNLHLFLLACTLAFAALVLVFRIGGRGSP